MFQIEKLDVDQSIIVCVPCSPFFCGLLLFSTVQKSSRSRGSSVPSGHPYRNRTVSRSPSRGARTRPTLSMPKSNDLCEPLPPLSSRLHLPYWSQTTHSSDSSEQYFLTRFFFSFLTVSQLRLNSPSFCQIRYPSVARRSTLPFVGPLLNPSLK